MEEQKQPQMHSGKLTELLTRPLENTVNIWESIACLQGALTERQIWLLVTIAVVLSTRCWL